MSNAPLACVLALALFLPTAYSQAPLNEGDLLKSLDSINLEPSAEKPRSALEDAPAPKKGGQTEITADNAQFNNNTHIAIFTGDVLVKNPDFNVNCDMLTAYLKSNDKPATGAAKVKPVSAPDAPAPSKPGKGGGLQKAVAEMVGEGKVIITQEKKEADGSVSHSVGKARKAVYNAENGEVTLTGWPEIKQGINSSVAVDESTTMIMTRDGKMRTIGRAKYLIQDSGNEKPAKP